MGFLQKTRTVILGHLNDLLDKSIDMNSIPVLKQYVRDLEDAIDSAQHQSAVSTAQVTTLSRELEVTQKSIDTDKQRAQAFLAKSNEQAARSVASRIHDQQQTVESLKSQITTATQQAAAMEVAVAKMQTKHNAMLTQVRTLEGKDRNSKALEQAASSIKSAATALGTSVDANVDDLARRIDARNDLAQEEFKRATDDMNSAPEDPLKEAAVDDILAGLKATTTAA